MGPSGETGSVTNTDVAIVSFDSTHQPGLAVLVEAVLAEFGFGVDPLLEADLADPGGHYGAVWVALDEGDVVGSVAVRDLGDGQAELKRMYLEPNYRGRGLGRQLLERALTWASAQGLDAVVLDTAEQMTGAQRLYESAGFKRLGARTESGVTNVAASCCTGSSCDGGERLHRHRALRHWAG